MFRRVAYFIAFIVFSLVGPANAGTAPRCLSLLVSQSPKSGIEPSDSVIFIALGHDSRKTQLLEKFAAQLRVALQRRVVTYRYFVKALYLFESEKWWEGTREKTTALVEQAIRRAVQIYPDAKVILFNLDGYDPEDLFSKPGQEKSFYTNFEARLLLCDPILFRSTRWYRAGRELTDGEAELFWAPIRARCDCGYLRRLVLLDLQLEPRFF